MAIEQRRSSEGELLAADDARLTGGTERRGERADLLALVALAAGNCARQRVEDDVLDALADRGRQLLVVEARDETRELGGRLPVRFRVPPRRAWHPSPSLPWPTSRSPT